MYALLCQVLSFSSRLYVHHSAFLFVRKVDWLREKGVGCMNSTEEEFMWTNLALWSPNLDICMLDFLFNRMTFECSVSSSILIELTVLMMLNKWVWFKNGKFELDVTESEFCVRIQKVLFHLEEWVKWK